MRFFYAKKKDFPCKRCKSNILRGEIFVRASYQNRESSMWYGFNYHPECYLKEFDRRFKQSWVYWKEKLIPPKKLGRPLVPTSDRPKRRRLLSLLNYHRKEGNLSRVQEIQNELGKLAQEVR